MGIAGLILGLVLGLAVPKLMGEKQQTAEAPPSPEHQEETAPKAPSPEQLNHVIGQYQKMLKDDPNNIQTLLELGGVYYSAQRFDEAITTIQKVIALDDKKHEAYIQLGNISYDTGKAQAAVEYYQKALELNPKMSDVRTDMATMYRKLGQFDNAIAELRRVNESDFNHYIAHLNLGIILRDDKKDLPGAKAAWGNFLKVMPGGPQAEQVKQMIAELDKQIAGQATKTN